MTPEGRIKVKVRKALKTLPSKCYSFMPVQAGLGAPGLDWYCCINGRFVAIETKAPGKKLTPRQVLTADAVVQAGGTVFVVRDESDITFMMKGFVRFGFDATMYDKGP